MGGLEERLGGRGLGRRRVRGVGVLSCRGGGVDVGQFGAVELGARGMTCGCMRHVSSEHAGERSERYADSLE